LKLTTNRILTVALIVALVAALMYAFAPKPVPVDLVEVQRGALVVTVDEDGKTRIRERYTVTAPLAGMLRRIEWKAGQPVKAGETLLAVIEPSDPMLLDARTQAQAEARVRAAEALKNQALPNRDAARSRAGYWQAERERGRKLVADGVMSRQELDELEMRARTAAEEMKSAEYAVQIAEFEWEQAKAALLRSKPDGSAEAETGRFEIVSPVDGRVLRVFQESATVVAAGTPLLEVGDPGDLEVEVDLLSTDAVKIAPGAKVFLEHWGGKNPLTGRVRLIEPAAFTKISALGVEEQRVWVKIDLVNGVGERPALGDAYRVETRVVTWESGDVLKVPTGALFRQGNDWAVFVESAGRARMKKVVIGHSNGLEAELLEGLSAGDRVISHPSDQIVEGTRIKPR
jgi:HlyD family secretion protein